MSSTATGLVDAAVGVVAGRSGMGGAAVDGAVAVVVAAAEAWTEGVLEVQIVRSTNTTQVVAMRGQRLGRRIPAAALARCCPDAGVEEDARRERGAYAGQKPRDILVSNLTVYTIS